MAKFKTEFSTDREANEMRHVEVEIDFEMNIEADSKFEMVIQSQADK